MDTWGYEPKSKKQKIENEKIEEEFIGDEMMLNPLGGLFSHNDDIKREGNNIYLYSAITKPKMLELILMLKTVEKENTKLAFEKNIEPPKIYLHINSYGGSIFAAFSLIDAIEKCTIPVVSIIEGCAASAATMISIACDERKITKHSFMLIHELRSGVWGKYSEIEEEYNNLKKLMKMIKDLYKKHTTIKMKELDKCLKKDIWWDAKDCLKFGLVDEIC